jgi:hypothetical protein
VEVGPQSIVQEQPKPVPESKFLKGKELHQPLNSGEEFLQELFEDGPISNIIPQHSRLRTRIMMKQKGKEPIKE